MGGVKGEDLRGTRRLLEAMVGMGREGRRRKFNELMKRGGCVPNEYLFGFLVRGLRRLGDEEGAKMVERDYEEWDVHGKWVEVEEGEEEMEVVGDEAREEEDGQGEQADPLVEEDERAEEDEPLHQLREVDPRPRDGGLTARRKRRRRATWESMREVASERRRAKGTAEEDPLDAK
ncbi:uncharacterized protein A4U43_C07F21110 [Asparagus officinalis]|uniref:Pentatricopeptide repeat-containing protein n=1 Tax=Asparagus officinalis TaxID=4686 RepID=A0A5P1EE05_ASPOF|nr:uncharacterized protein A4U43_C07F21110 [Asparagus officinalis]